MRKRSTRGWVPGPLGSLGLRLGIGAIVLTAALDARSETRQAPPTQVASSSVAPEERSQEVLLRELAQPPFLVPETFTDLLYAMPPPVIGGLGVELE